MKIADLTKYEKETGKTFTLVNDWEETREILNHVGSALDWETVSLFVSINEGDYDEIFYFHGVVPYLDKPLEKVEIRW